MTLQELREVIREKIGSGTQKEFALSTGISNSYLNDILNGHREPGLKFLMAIGYRRVVKYERVAQ